MQISVQIAGRNIVIETETSELTRRFRGYLADHPGDIFVCVEEKDTNFEREKSINEDKVEGISPREFTNEYLEFIAIQRKIAEELFEYDTLLFHGSVVAVDGVGYLFTAKSGTGKSTHTRLWREVFGERAVMVNDDKPFLRITDEGVLAYGSPWNGKHGLGTNICVPLKAICILERGEENRIRKIPAKEAVFMLLQQSNRPMQMQRMPKYLELIDALSEKVEFYRLACNMTPQAAQVSFDAMSQSK